AGRSASESRAPRRLRVSEACRALCSARAVAVVGGLRTTPPLGLNVRAGPRAIRGRAANHVRVRSTTWREVSCWAPDRAATRNAMRPRLLSPAFVCFFLAHADEPAPATWMTPEAFS